MMQKICLASLFFCGFLGAEQKILEPYREAPKPVLNPEQKTKLEQGELVFSEKKEDWPDTRFYREGFAVFRIKAKPEAVWKVLGNFSQYPEWAYKVKATESYQKQNGDKYYIKFTTKVVNKNYYVEHDFPMMKKGYGTWKTDHTQKSDCVLDTVGYWRVDPVGPDESDVYYGGKVVLTRLCAKGFLGIGGFSGPDMAKQTYDNMKAKLKP